MDLRMFYLENVSEQEYYYRFYTLVKNVNSTFNIFEGSQETNVYEFFVDDIDDVIEKFRKLCQPENENLNIEDACWFYILLFYLHKCGYIIEEFPRVIERPPVDSYDFINRDIRNKVIAEGKDEGGTVRYKERRVLVANLTFKQTDKYIELADAIESKFKEISNRQATFQNMSTDEKLAEIANLIENLLKKDGKFLSIDYSKMCFDHINEDNIKKYRKRIQCYRHSSVEAISERDSFTKEQKIFLIDFGLTVIKVIHALLSDE